MPWAFGIVLYLICVASIVSDVLLQEFQEMGQALPGQVGWSRPWLRASSSVKLDYIDYIACHRLL